MLILTIIVFVALVLALIRHEWLMLVFVATMGWIPAYAGREILGPMDIGHMLFVSAVLFSLPWIFKKGGLRLGRMGKFAVAYWLLSCIANAAGMASHPELTRWIIHQMLKDITVVAFIVVLEASMQDAAFVRKLVVALLVSAAGVALTTLLSQYAPGLPLVKLWARSVPTGEEFERVRGTMMGPFISGAFLIGAAGVSLAAVTSARGIGRKVLAGALFLSVTVAAILGQSRATYVGIAIVLLLSANRLRRALVVLALVLLGFLVVIQRPELSQRIVGRVSAADLTLSGRTALWSDYFANSPTYVWFVGEGFTVQSFREVPMHMSYLEVLSDAGPLGLVLFVSLWYHVLSGARRIRLSRGTKTEKMFGLAAVRVAIALLVSSLVTGLIVEITYRLMLMIWISIPLAPCWEKGAEAIEPAEVVFLPEGEYESPVHI